MLDNHRLLLHTYFQSDQLAGCVQDEIVVQTEHTKMRREQLRQEKEAARRAEAEKKEASRRAEAEKKETARQAEAEQKEAARRAEAEQKEASRLADAEKIRAERLAQAFAAKEAAAAEALETQVVPSWVVDKMLAIAEPGDHVAAEQESQEGPRLPMLLDDALAEIHNDFLAEKATVEKRLASMGLVAAKPSEVEEDDAIVDATASLSQTAGLADEVDEEETLVPVPPSPEPWQRAAGSGPGTGEIAEELDDPGDVDG